MTDYDFMKKPPNYTFLWTYAVTMGAYGYFAPVDWFTKVLVLLLCGRAMLMDFAAAKYGWWWKPRVPNVVNR